MGPGPPACDILLLSNQHAGVAAAELAGITYDDVISGPSWAVGGDGTPVSLGHCCRSGGRWCICWHWTRQPGSPYSKSSSATASASWHVVVASSLLHVWVDWLPAPKWVHAQQQEARACRWSSCSLTCGGPDRAGSHLPYQHGIWDWCKVEGLSIVHCIGRRECVKGHFAGGSCLHCCHKWVRKPNCWCSHSGQSTRLNSKVRAPDSCIGVVCKSKSEPLRVVEAARSHPCVEDVLHSSGPCICGCCLASYNPAMQIVHGTSSYVFLAMPMLYVHSSLPSLAWAGRP